MTKEIHKVRMRLFNSIKMINDFRDARLLTVKANSINMNE